MRCWSKFSEGASVWHGWHQLAPEVQHHDFAAKVGEARRLAVERELKILLGAAAQAGFTLAIVGGCKEIQQASHEGERQSGNEFPLPEPPTTSHNECISYSSQFSSPAQRTQKTLVSAIIPARNEEASIARAVESVAAQPEVEEVIVVNDQSRDRTSEILAELALRIPKLKVLETHELPSSWTGKNYALSIGAAAARGDWLLFTDADTYHLLGSTRLALSPMPSNTLPRLVSVLARAGAGDILGSELLIPFRLLPSGEPDFRLLA